MTHDSIRIILDEHRAVSAVLRSLMAMLERGPGDEPERFFDVVLVQNDEIGRASCRERV